MKRIEIITLKKLNSISLDQQLGCRAKQRQHTVENTNGRTSKRAALKRRLLGCFGGLEKKRIECAQVLHRSFIESGHRRLQLMALMDMFLPYGLRPLPPVLDHCSLL